MKRSDNGWMIPGIAEWRTDWIRRTYPDDCTEPTEKDNGLPLYIDREKAHRDLKASGIDTPPFVGDYEAVERCAVHDLNKSFGVAGYRGCGTRENPNQRQGGMLVRITHPLYTPKQDIAKTIRKLISAVDIEKAVEKENKLVAKLHPGWSRVQTEMYVKHRMREALKEEAERLLNMASNL